MKFNCGDSFKKKCEKLENWHGWFAWRPVRVGENDCRWLETVQRKGTHCWTGWPGSFWQWEYKPMKEEIHVLDKG